MPSEMLHALLTKLGLRRGTKRAQHQAYRRSFESRTHAARDKHVEGLDNDVQGQWTEVADIVSHVQTFLDMRDVLACDCVCRTWRAAKGKLGQVSLGPTASKKASKAQRIFLASNAARLQAVALKLEESTTAAHRQLSSSKHAKELVALACQATTAHSLQLSSSSKLLQLPDSLVDMHNLQVLSISWFTNLTSLPAALGNLQQLQHLTLRACKGLAALPDSISQLVMLQQMELRGCDSLRTLPPLPSNLQRLVMVECGQLHEMAAADPAASDSSRGSLGHLTQLQELHITKCGIKQLPDFSADMAACRIIVISQCPNLHALPASICSLPALQELTVGLRLQTLPDNLGNLSELRCLRVQQGSKAESAVPASIGQLAVLEELEVMDWPGLQHLPITLGELTALKHLKIQSCGGLSALPRSLGSLSNLQHLMVSSCNQLVSLPESLGDLSALQSLALVDCEDLRTLPRSLEGLRGLQHLTVSFCSRLKSLPDTLGVLATSAGSLKRVTINGCESLQLPISLEPLKGKITPGCLAGAVAAQAIAAWRGEEIAE